MSNGGTPSRLVLASQPSASHLRPTFTGPVISAVAVGTHSTTVHPDLLIARHTPSRFPDAAAVAVRVRPLLMPPSWARPWDKLLATPCGPRAVSPAAASTEAHPYAMGPVVSPDQGPEETA